MIRLFHHNLDASIAEILCIQSITKDCMVTSTNFRMSSNAKRPGASLRVFLFLYGKQSYFWETVLVHLTVTRGKRVDDHMSRFKTGIFTNSDDRKNDGNIKVHKK